MRLRHSLLALVFVIPLACSGSDMPGDGSGGGGGGGGGGGADAGPNGSNSVTECSNGIDDDGDGLVDGFDPECTGAADNREDSFSTGIPGDNIDAIKQDCFFDGDSGHGNDGCLMHTCCLLDGPCPPELKPEQFDPAKCEVSADCIDFCAPLTPPGCDCFGCCTVCDGDDCNDILINPEVAPDCTADQAGNPSVCPTCTKRDECGPSDCFELECQLCPGQTAEDLPESCGATNECPNGLTTCTVNADCADGMFCSTGCCINEVT